MALETPFLRAFLNLGVVPIFLAAAWYFAAGRSRRPDGWLMAAFLGLLAIRSTASGLGDLAGPTTPGGVAWAATFYDLNLITFTVYLWFSTWFPRAPSRSEPLSLVWLALVALESLLVASWFVARGLHLAAGASAPLRDWMLNGLTFLSLASIGLVAWRGRALPAAQRRGLVIVVVGVFVAQFNIVGNDFVTLVLGGNLLDALRDPSFDVGVAALVLFAFVWRVRFPIHIVLYGATFAGLRLLVGQDFSNFSLLLAVRGLAPVYAAQRTGVFEISKPQAWVTRTLAVAALASLFGMVNAIGVVVSEGAALAVAITVFLGLAAGVIAASAALPRGFRSMIPARFDRLDARPAPSRDGVLLDRYRFERHLGDGGQGTAGLYLDEKLQRHVVLKRVRGGQGEPAMREARALARVGHEHVVRVFDTDVAGGDGIIVMEYVEGGSLAGLLARRPGGALEPREAVRIARQMLGALHACHEAGVVHGDVKPENVLLAANGDVKLADFGSARQAANVTLVPGGGTLRYMAPEQWRGESATARSDVYSTGVVLHEMLTGSRRFGDAPEEPVFLALGLGPDAKIALPESAALLEPALRRACSRTPEDRFASARDFLDAIRALDGSG